MTISEMQNNLIRLVLDTQDSKLLGQVINMFKTKQPEQTPDWWDEISEEEKEMIKISERQIEKGEVMTWEQVKKNADSMLKSKVA